jgi:hypothetical protein
MMLPDNLTNYRPQCWVTLDFDNNTGTTLHCSLAAVQPECRVGISNSRISTSSASAISLSNFKVG